MHICTSIQYSVPDFNKKLNIKKHATFFGKRISKLKSTQKITKETVFILTRYFQKNICIGKLHCAGLTREVPLPPCGTQGSGPIPYENKALLCRLPDDNYYQA